MNDGSACGLRRESVFFTAGRVFTQAGIPVSGAEPYCLAAWIRGNSGASPFLGIQLSDINGNLAGQEHWLIGQAGYPTNYGDTVTAVTSNGDWAWYVKPFTMDPSATAVVLKDENNAGGTADFDTIGSFPAIVRVARHCVRGANCRNRATRAPLTCPSPHPPKTREGAPPVAGDRGTGARCSRAWPRPRWSSPASDRRWACRDSAFSTTSCPFGIVVIVEPAALIAV